MSTPPPIPPLAKKIVVEPLSDDRLTRIERNVVSRSVVAPPVHLQVLTRWLSFAVAVGATALIAGVLGWLAHGRNAGRAPRAAEVASVGVHTDTQGSTIDIGDATIASSPSTAFVVTRPDGGVLVDMSRGRIELDVAKRGARPPLVVRAGDTEVIVIGTHFTVDYGDGGQSDVDVRVREGRVRIVRHQHEVVVSSGQEWTSQSDAVVALADVGSAAAGANPPGDGSGGATLDDSHKPGNDAFEVHVGPGPKVLHDHVAAVPDPHQPRPAATHKHEDASAAAPVSAGSAECSVTLPNGTIVSCGEARREEEQRSNPAQEIRSAILGVSLPAPLDVGAADATAMAKAYHDMLFANPGESSDKRVFGEKASQALYSLAQVQALRLFRTDDALTSLDSYMRRFAHGAELRDVLWLRLRILCDRSIRGNHKINAACHEAAQVYEDKAPNGAGAHVAELILATPE